MKKILFTLAVVLAGFNFQSCSLHEDNDVFGSSAAERIDEAVKADRELLESASNGWILRYYTGQNYSGGGHTFLCKFKDGKATVAADITSDPSATSHSSYNIVKEAGPVLTFDTFNEIMHELASPSQSDIDGEQGDYEFRIQKTTNDSIYLEGRKWGNKMVMVRMPEGQDWAEYLSKITETDRAISYNNKVMVGNDSIGYAAVDYEGRRVSFEIDGTTKDVAYYATPEGIHLQSPVTVNGKQLSDLAFNAQADQLTDAKADGVTLAGFKPAGYKPIEFWEGNWQLVYQVATNDGQPSGKYSAYSLTLEESSANYLLGHVTVNGRTFDMYFEFDRHYGSVAFINQYIEDPTGTYSWLMCAPVCFKEGGYFNFKGKLIAKWNEAENRAYFEWDKVGTYAVDSFVFLAANAQGSPEYDENGQLISMGQIAYVAGLQRPQDN